MEKDDYVSIPFVCTNRAFRLSSYPLFRPSLFIPELVSPIGKHLVEVVLKPPDVGAQPGKLPHAVDLAVPVLVGAVGVALDGNLGARLVRVLLVRHAQLVLFPLGRADEVLRLEERVAQHRGRRDHGDVFFGRHGFPELVEEGAVVDLCVGGGAIVRNEE
jgi:hypothetical protein